MKKLSLVQLLKLFLIYMILDFGSQLLFYVGLGLNKEEYISNAVVSMLPLAFLLYNFDYISRPPVMPLTTKQKVLKFLMYVVIAFVMVLILTFLMDILFN
ncbi:hypothetical protein [Haloplasma contractile]|uniref:Uncharacterized protein n=1 Tax=Haloplasma contractile SSD-17B TaxID=1033810 RepID=U2FJQ5_9MOLU|nr:hypothetical protein [Haloplasma contractile]ERJ11489.1 hypothetical protein HLPCO_002401 [Haloplasma contractile SSD-17B]